MSAPKRLALFVEGEGDAQAAPVLLKRLLTEYNAWEHLFLDPTPFVVGNCGDVVCKEAKNWVRWLKDAAKTRKSLGGVLLLLDGDIKRVQGRVFCARDEARYLSEKAREAGAGAVFSVATVFACCEYESWLIAGVESLAGKPLPDGRAGIKPETSAPEGDLEARRDAAGWLRKQMVAGYKKTTDQAQLTALVDLDLIRKRGLRSFQRLEAAVKQLVQAIASGAHVVTPVPPPAEATEQPEK